MKLIPLLTFTLCALISPLAAETTTKDTKKSTTTKTTKKTKTKPASTKKTTKPKTTDKKATKKTTSTKTKPKTTSKDTKKKTDSKSSSTSKTSKKATPAKKATGNWKVEASEADQGKAKKYAKKMSSTKRAALLKLINKGTKAEMLADLKGVGEKKVQYLVKGRPYKTVDGLVNINGFGVKTLETLFTSYNTKK